MKKYLKFSGAKFHLFSYKRMVRRSARLRNKAPGENDEKNERVSNENEPETIENLAKRTYELIKEKVGKNRENLNSVVASEKDNEREKAAEFISVSSRVKDNVSDCHTLASELNPGMDVDDLYFKMDQSNSKAIPSMTKDFTHFNEKQVMNKSVITSEFEKKETAPQYHVTHHALKKQKKKEKGMSAGRNWFDMPAPEMTQELQRDLNILRMRNVLDPKRHYKKNKSKKLPKYFQIGTVVSGPAEFYSSRLPNRERKQTIVGSLLADAEFRRYNKRKYLEIQASKEKGRKKGFYRRTKRKRR